MKYTKKLLLGLLCIIMVASIIGCSSNKQSDSEEKDGFIEVEGGNKLEYNFDVPYFGNITIGSKTFNMASPVDKIKELGFKRVVSAAFDYEDDNGNRFFFQDVPSDDSFSVDFLTYNTAYKDNGYNGYVIVSENIKLPGNITYNSTIDDVIETYGEPNSRYERTSLTGQRGDEIDVPSTSLNYSCTNTNGTLTMELCFMKSTGKLYEINYSIYIYNQ